MDWAGWVDRWDRQQEGYVPDREERIGLMLEVVDRLGARPGRLLDLACGPGTLSAHVLRRFPDAQVTGVDVDPFLLELGRRTLGDRVAFRDLDIRRSDWGAAVGGDPFDAVLSATALHWLGVEDLRSVALVLAERLRPGGVVVNYDTILADGSAPRLARLAADLNEAAWEQADAAEDWTAWWDAARAEPEFAELLAERDRRFGHIEHGPGLTLEESVTAFTSAGFAEVGTVTQWADRRMLVAIR